MQFMLVWVTRETHTPATLNDTVRVFASPSRRSGARACVCVCTLRYNVRVSLTHTHTHTPLRTLAITLAHRTRTHLNWFLEHARAYGADELLVDVTLKSGQLVAHFVRICVCVVAAAAADAAAAGLVVWNWSGQTTRDVHTRTREIT